MIEPFVIHEIEMEANARIGICRLPGRSGDLEGDIRTLSQWPAAILVSMTEIAESEAKGAAGLNAALARAGIRHLCFPIRDFGVPEAGSGDWSGIAPHLHAALDAGAGVALHCLGGKGRSGMVALRLMVERAMAPEAALARIRKTRPGAVETQAQLAWGALGTRSLHAASGH